jgi:CheY-like chemotaxis protein/cytidylate kinase
MVTAEAARIADLPEAKIQRAFAAKTSVFNKFTHEKERSVAYIKLALAQMLADEQILIFGFCSHLIPREITHVLKVCLIADYKFRTAAVAEQQGVSEKEAARLIARQDEDIAVWVHSIHGHKDPWDASLYDILIPMDKMEPEAAVDLILRNFEKDVLRPTAASRQAVADFMLAARTEVALAEEGHLVGVTAANGALTLTIHKHVLMLSRLEEELKAIASKVPGVRTVTTKVGKGFYQTDIYRKYDFDVSSKVLLVDDEREFAQTLSERLQMRDLGSAVAYDGESALQILAEDEPEVMILDLKMPGINGLEVLRRVKEQRPEVEVIILTGHGSEEDRDTCLQLGAFAYLQKPVDIDTLTETLKQAREKMRRNLAAKRKR